MLGAIDGPDGSDLANPGADVLALTDDGGALSAVVKVAAQEDVDVDTAVGEKAERLVSRPLKSKGVPWAPVK